jgi:hypothetical protein
MQTRQTTTVGELIAMLQKLPLTSVIVQTSPEVNGAWCKFHAKPVAIALDHPSNSPNAPHKIIGEWDSDDIAEFKADHPGCRVVFGYSLE